MRWLIFRVVTPYQFRAYLRSEFTINEMISKQTHDENKNIRMKMSKTDNAHMINER